ncbi:MAG: hypothetical protein CM1200mP14_21110 [Gammaproteobacteria bacterium]|nr:MAG: hypothetical protein CM1200mP14_21110 [Gammaproteobacteria bacterium]
MSREGLLRLPERIEHVACDIAVGRVTWTFQMNLYLIHPHFFDTAARAASMGYGAQFSYRFRSDDV